MLSYKKDQADFINDFVLVPLGERVRYAPLLSYFSLAKSALYGNKY